ncbi:MFS transporter [Pullulanibacillus camelliae]|uniref:MFS transporter n=1 Tax=Pullulanibacillus camelliae TaxID=1707096 RepID=A0A8J2YNR0_9BACL|nr:YbfB/YjiJ family MFS transporter [Pullulanibacillus camelliae]GGE56204.1 MFS transporter [Pullulanibacillus camelliae]
MSFEKGKNLSTAEIEVWFQVIAGLFALFIAMGVGRFAYTPILPLMQSSTHFSNAIAGYLASSNYIGYLIGAFAAGSIPFIHRHKLQSFRWSLLVCVATTGFMGLGHTVGLWYVLRFLSGLSSGLVFVLISSIVLDILVKKNQLKLSGVLYAGVGLGISITGVIIPLLNHPFGWRGTWLGLMVLTILLGVPTMLWLRKDQAEISPQLPSKAKSVNEKRSPFFLWLVIAYGCEGIGYIITGTFIVEIAHHTPMLNGLATYCWVLVGLAAIPSTVLWTFASDKWGRITVLIIAYLLQAFGVILPVIAPNALGIFIGAILFGGTFVGITTMVNNLGKALNPHNSSKVIGILTGVYSVGQIIGATGAGLLANKLGGFTLPILLAGALLIIGVASLLVGIFISRTKRMNRSY